MTEKVPSDHPEYHKRYYREHRDEIAGKKKSRYQEDSEYSGKIIRRAREKRAEQKRVREEARLKASKKDPMKPKEFFVRIDGNEIQIQTYSTSQVARALNRTAQTVRLWEKQGVLPTATYRSSAGNRLYTEFQLQMLVAAFFAIIDEHGKLKLSDFSNYAREIWDNYPYGIEV